MIKRTWIVILLSIFLAACGGVQGPAPIDWSEGEEVIEFNEINQNQTVSEMSHQEFIDFIGEMACESMRKTGVPASVTIAQAILETGWGKSTIQDAKNLFGVKGVGPAGSNEVETRECNASGCYTTTAKFKKYNSFQESIDDHAKIFSLSYYTEAMKHIDDPDEFARQLTGVYATDPKYGELLISIMQSNNLYAYDAKCSP